MFSESLTLKVKGKLVRQLRKYTEIVILVTADSKYECFKEFFNYCNMNICNICNISGHFLLRGSTETKQN